jgi:hypothetical protein
VDAAEYAPPNTGARITGRNSANGALLIRGLPIRAPEDGENKNLPASTMRFDFNQCHCV